MDIVIIIKKLRKAVPWINKLIASMTTMISTVLSIDQKRELCFFLFLFLLLLLLILLSVFICLFF